MSKIVFVPFHWQVMYSIECQKLPSKVRTLGFGLIFMEKCKKLLTNTTKAVIICNVAFYVNRKMGGR